jgi:hypothetical protein
MEETEGPQVTSQYGAYALHAGLVRLYTRIHMHTPTRPDTHMHASTHTQINKQYLLLFHGNNDS